MNKLGWLNFNHDQPRGEQIFKRLLNYGYAFDCKTPVRLANRAAIVAPANTFSGFSSEKDCSRRVDAMPRPQSGHLSAS